VDIGIGLPNPVPNSPGRLLPEWAHEAESYGFRSLATIDRVAFPNHDSLIALAASAAVTESIELLTNILLLPTRNTALVAKQAATIASIAEGRFTLGIGVGGRKDDFDVTGSDFSDRGSRTDEMLDQMRAAWRGELLPGSSEPIAPSLPDNTVPLIIGGASDAAIRRTVQYGVGWTAGGAPPEQVAGMAAKVRQAWAESDREGSPRILALAYFSIGDDVEDASYAYLRHYYGFLGEWVERIAGSALRGADAITAALQRYEDAGVDELILDPTVAELSQVKRLAEIVL
jgi:alkanesulfonate monooxygenase SsuD/methylene tetrahydromethanopterin reductase-like flavin-dependent oxidoreductase (luciferase family)